MLRRAVLELDGPVALRYPRGGSAALPAITVPDKPLVTIVSYGAIAHEAIFAANALCARGIAAECIRLTCLAPLDPAPVLESVKKSGRLVVAEDTAAAGCIGAVLLAQLEREGICARARLLNLGSGVVQQGSVGALRRMLRLDAEGITAAVEEVLADE